MNDDCIIRRVDNTATESGMIHQRSDEIFQGYGEIEDPSNEGGEFNP